MLYTLLFDAEELAAATNEGEKISRTALAFGYRHLYGGELPEIILNDSGKPSFSSGAPAFSISHSGGLVALALSDTASALGVDIERHREIIQREKIEKRLLAGLDTPKWDGGEAEIIFLGLNREKRETEPTRAKKMGFFERWTLLESLLKCDGGGFSAVGRAEALLVSHSAQVYNIVYRGEEYSLSIAVG